MDKFYLDHTHTLGARDSQNYHKPPQCDFIARDF